MDWFIHFLCDAALEALRQWLRDWGILLLTAVIAFAAILQVIAAAVQGIFAKRVYNLQKFIEDTNRTPHLFCRIKGHAGGTVFTSLEAQLSNLSSHGIWIEEMVIVFDGPVACAPTVTRNVAIVLAASQTENWQLSCVPFSDIVPVGQTQQLKFKLQVKFIYSTASVIGTQTSPVYDVTIHQSVVTDLRPER